MEIEKLFTDEKLKEAVIKAESVEKLESVLRERGIAFDSAELTSALSDAPDGELNEDALEGVAGGSWVSLLANFIKALRYKAGGGGFSSSGGGSGAFGGGSIGSR